FQSFFIAYHFINKFFIHSHFFHINRLIIKGLTICNYDNSSEGSSYSPYLAHAFLFFTFAIIEDFYKQLNGGIIEYTENI
ncbi:MAG: hypothetical protein ABI267_05605, partial [Ginsengibacter sp.]